MKNLLSRYWNSLAGGTDKHDSFQLGVREGYKIGLRQGHADAWHGNLPPCPECGRHVPPVKSEDHESSCRYGRRG